MSSAMMAAVDRFVTAFNDADFEAMRALLHPSLVAFVTTDDGDQVPVDGADAYVASIRAMLVKEPTDYSATLTQKPSAVDDDRVLLMLEIRARRGERTLHNFSAQLFRFDGELVTEIRMTDAKPAESAAFWA